ncbi:hypothetical protein SPRG_02922 [Saprolegnia parasitica CBS 223.65]|uniref:Uncharacterized protein n=1 Tax=Saprolegnia parasitica (strain CBS 223.65) TaxID=695850 RepID=A0A067CT56_SAPPC|nr:hypothetical protein SPRG_02922 [Saprolegnia parasitica CBS 223.65]KDO32445.1 hypothetical protein SPRG_02922 [Saprolegnia parasitica CBS 223.65]|eukprot:XP_012196896.1 hypothetical protein SPRG_02922 [Saprolegnia parasitica CBS 223.65]
MSSMVELERTITDDDDDVHVAVVDDGAETEDVEADDEDPLSVLGKRPHEDMSDASPQGKRLRKDAVDVIDLGDEDDDDDDDDDDEDDEDEDRHVVSVSPHRPFSKNDAKNFNMKNAKASGAAYEQAQAPLSTHSPSIQRLLDSIDSKTKMELFSDALETYGNDLFHGHESWRDQLLIKACRLDPSFVTTITELARPSGAYNSPLVLSGEEDEADVEDDDDDDDTSSVEIIEPQEQEIAQSGDDEDDDELNLVSGDDELNLGDFLQ